ncbi:transcription factor bHLH160-like [Impatiens glandulifera]|uniref:transcription factor bHLH160-like n=1 Tax=Impatiens glandulifera TaxID=253017 RepID=UPI001FB0C50D|nr:transcription factor bHLH160-like [Impatiens glandulifera]
MSFSPLRNNQISFEDEDLSYYIEALDGYDPSPIFEEYCNTLQVVSPSKLESTPNNMANETLATSIPGRKNLNELGNPSSSKCKKSFKSDEKKCIAQGINIGEMEKKLDHNARERVRRMNLSVSYLTLRSLLPDARRSKKKWSSAKIVEKVLEYIPKIEDEVRKLKEIMIMNEEAIKAERIKQRTKYSSSNSVMVSEIKRGEVIIQACMKNNIFSRILENLEAEEDGTLIISSASIVTLSDQTTVCCTLHIQGRPETFDHKRIPFVPTSPI